MYPDDKPALPGLFEATKNLTTAQAAQIIKISKGYGIPTIEAASAFPAFGSYANDDVDWDGFRVRAPLSTEFLLGDPYYAKALQANIRDLETAEGTIKTWKALQNGFKGVGRNLLRFGQMVQETVQNADNTLAPINEAEVWANPAQESVRAFENPKEFIPATTLRKLAESSWLKPKANTPNGLGEELWLGFIETAPQIAAQLLVAGATGGTSGLVAGTAFMGSQIAGGQYEKLTGDKVEPFRAMQASVADAVLQAPLEMIGLSKIFKRIPAGKTAKAYFEKATTEAVTEWLQQYPEAATEIWATRPGITPQQIASEIMNDIANFGPITQEGLKQGIIAAPFGLLGGYAANSAAKMAQRRAEANKAYLERLQELKTTSPEATAEYINHVTDGEVVYAQPDVLYQLAKEKPELLEQLGVTEQELELAIEEGQLVEIPVGEYSVVMGNNPEAAAVLNEHVTTEENEATLTEARDRAAVKRNRRDVEKAVSKVEERRIELKAAQKELYDEAVSAGMGAKEAKGFVSMFTAHSRVMAAGMGANHAEWFRANRPVLKKADGSIAGKLLQKAKSVFGIKTAQQNINLGGNSPLGFYSATKRAIEAMDFKTMPAADLANRITKTPGIKQEELDDLGLIDWLKGQGGKVAKEQVIAYVEQGGAMIEEVTKGSSAVKRSPAEWERLIADAERRGDWNEADRLTREMEDNELGNNANGTGNDPKFGQYQLPGGENYREVLLTLPTKSTKAIQAEEIIDAVSRDWEQGEAAQEKYGMTYKEALEIAEQANGIHATFRSNHWEEQNVLAHFRLNERTVDGKKVLFIEEIQSDWHQKGKKEGYGNTERYGVFVNENLIGEFASKSEAKAALATAGGKGEILDWSKKGIPDAPFKSTPAWSMLAFKRILRLAAEQGYDSVAWTPGEVQAERYDLSKQISSLAWSPYDNGTGLLYAEDHSKNKVISKVIKETELEENVGKDVAKKLIEQPTEDGMKMLQGLDLKVGGEGMKGFYDKILPAEVGKYIKKLDKDAKVEIVNIYGAKKRSGEFDSFYTDEAIAKWDKEESSHSVWSITITDKIRDAVMQGQTLYQAAKGSIHWENGQAIISLFKSADASTGIHELLGHYMTQNLLDVGMQENAPDWMKQDRKTMLEWAGVEDWDSATKEQKVEAHEKWARAAEAYIMEGKAPSLDLRDVFRRFADWLRQIYRSVKELGVEVSPEMRGVFDRMLASEEEILQAAEVNLFMEENADLYEGLSEKERDKLNQQFDKIMERGKEILLSELIGDINTERKTVMASERERIEEEVYNELSNQPFYRMVRELRKPAIRNPVEELTRQWEKKVDGLARYLRENHGDGVENVKIYDGDINDEQAKVEKYFRVSHNAKWYQKLYEELGKKPTLADYKGLAENFLRDGFEDLSGYVDPDVEFLELEKQIAELQKTPQAIPWVTKLNTAWLKENYPDEMNTFAFMHSNLGQYDLDDVASFYRFSSADEIIWRMKNTPPLSKAVKDAVNARMNAAFPEMSREEIREAAEASMYNEESVSLLAIQLDLIREKAGQIRTAEESRKQAAQDREIAKAGAQRAISRMSVDRAMKLATWIAAERRAAEKVEKAIAKGNWSAAFEQKTIQLHNHAMVIESLKIKREFDRINRALKKHQTSEAKTWISDEENPDGTRSKTTKHLAAASEILRRFGFERKDAPKAEESLAQYLGRMEAQNPDMYGVAGWLVYDDKKTSIRELTIDKLRDVNNALRNIKKMARAGQNSDAFLTLNGDGLAITTNNLVDIADINVKDRQIDAPDKVAPSKMAEFMAGLRKPSKWLLELDGFKDFGEWAKAFYHSLADATDYKSKLVNRAVDRIEAAYEKAGIDKAQRERDAHNKIYIPEWEASVSKNWLMAALLNMGSESNMKRLFSRNPVGITLYGPWSQETLTSVLERELDAKYFRLAQEIWDAIDMYEEYTAMIRRVTGADMKKVNPQPISFNVKGETIHLRGGYYHLKADSRSSKQAELRAEQEVGDAPWISPYPNSGASKERAAAASYAVDLDLSNIYQSIQSQAHDIAFRPVALDINKLMRQDAIKEVMRRKLGDASYNAFNKWLRVNLTGKETREKGFMDDEANFLRQRAVVANLLFRVGTVFQNLANPALYGGAVEGFGQKDALRSYLQYGVSDYIPKALSFSQAAEDIRQEVFSLSAMMRDKAQNPDYTLRDMFGRQGGFLLKSETGMEIGIRLKITRENVLKFGSGMLAFGDQLSDIPMWRGAYFKALSEGKPQREAVRFADSVIENSSGTGRALDSSQLQMGSPLEKLLTMFMTFLNTQYNRWANEAGIYMKEKDHLRLLSFLGTQYIFFGVLSAGLSFKVKKDDDDWSEWFVKEVLEWPLSMIPIGGGLFKYVIDRAMGFKTFNWSASPVERNIEQIANLAFNKKDTPRTIEDTMQAMSFIFGYPDQFNDWLWNLYDISSGMDPRPMDLIKRRPVRER